ncbi:MAG: hypothetical protein KY455_06505 [Euryarchaeota archaeon]|nr:hypothetical protein [Euryarchaeota archaeon]
MKSAVLLALVWSVTLFAGCHALDGGGDDDPDPTSSPTTTGTPTTTTTTSPSPTPTEPPEEEPALSAAAIVNHTTEANAGEELNITWELRTTTGEAITVDRTEIVWSNATFTPAQAANGTIEGRQDSVDAPGTFNVTFTVDEAGTVYVRAHAVDGDTEVWSDIIEIEVKGGGATGGTTHIVSIGMKVVSVGGQTFKTGEGQTSFFEPQNITITLGDSVVWRNEDQKGDVEHSAVDCPDPAQQQDACTDPPDWRTAQIDVGEESAPITFTTAGTYWYFCDVHPGSTTMGKPTASQNQIKVVAPS